ncbi:MULTISPECIES: coiled-coil domain-containing protein [Bacillus]|uniref:DUF5082 domain-containing protein n=1 Tax=Bacillus velezensis TaxID=492670 RepID=A0ABC8DDC2_BACVE|nr:MULTISPECIES: DUF5082 family protein [Bacillus]AKL78074.1 hypothetical protein ABH13_3500 [Bacillus velezensis]AMR51968.1 hypothetical protein A1R12_16975 [Bacillus amyloliquefaciens]ANB47924.1 hypothetical protein A1D33_011500 [Bacillus velezensis]ANB85303.1 hypothetical protein A6R78_15405 [Bacillus velezensis]AQP96686.1 DUF5082 domain-containing protein [Bacillus sp. 275]
MSHSSTLSHINSTISHKLGEVEHQIDKLKEAKREIESLQEEGVSEIRDILRPHLDHHWTGTFAEEFDDRRDQAHTEAYRIVTDKYDGYIYRIGLKMTQLEIEKGGLLAARSIAREAEHLLTLGEEALDTVGEKIQSIKKSWSWF